MSVSVREAILLGANAIESRPDLYNYGKCGIPACGSPGCVLGHIGFFLGIPLTKSVGSVSQALGLSDSLMFYDRLNAIIGRDWVDNAALAVEGMRLYADKYHPETLLPSGSEIAREIMSRPFKERVGA